jgi:type I restriction enzyme S subunit
MRASRVFALDTTEKLTKAGIEKTHIHVSPPGTIFLSFKLTVGEVVIAADSMATNEAIAHFETDDRALRDYTYFYLSSFQYDKLGSTSAIARAINSDIVRKMEFVLPTRNSLESFEKNVAPMLDQIEKLSKQNDVLSSTRDMLLPRLINGEEKLLNKEM